MITYKEYKTFTPHDPFIAGNNLSHFVGGYFPTDELKKLLKPGMFIPSDEVMDREFPTVEKIEGMHPYLTLFSRCSNVRDTATEIELRPYLEVNTFFPITYRHKGEERLCSYMPVLYLDFLLGTIGGAILGLRKEFHRNLKFTEADTSSSFAIENIISASFPRTSTEDIVDLDPFFAQIFTKPTLTYSYFKKTDFYTTLVHPVRVHKASAIYEWNYKGSVIKSDQHTFVNFSEYSFTTSRAMRYDAYFHPKYPVPGLSAEA
jgi:hypothetical protein